MKNINTSHVGIAMIIGGVVGYMIGKRR